MFKMASLLQGLIVLHLFQAYVCSCYFSVELQGEFLMQSVIMGTTVQYSKVNITSEAIPIWGSCHRHIGNNVLLIDSLNGGSCIRCFNLKLRSKNILQVQTEGLDKCYTSEEAAEPTCPSEDSLNNYREIILYKTKGIDEENITKAYCPINGKYKFTYSINDGSEQKMECTNPTSLLDDCSVPEGSASALNLKFQGCSFEDHDIKYDCLGDWEGPDNQRYLALVDTRLHGEQRPQYRCAMYKEDKETGNVFMALASDSTCTTDLHSAMSGFETYNFTSEGFGEWPDLFEAPCRFPMWSVGEWEHLQVDSEFITYRDHSTFQTLTMRCETPETTNNTNERFLVFSRSACGQETYNCIWLKQRGMNVLEFQLGLTSSKEYNTRLCSNSNFVDNEWVTQGRLEGLYESPCPVMGNYTGFIPNKMQLCAKLSSDERSREIMYYTVSDCWPLEEIYEGSYYQRYGRKKRQTEINSNIFRISNITSNTEKKLQNSSIPLESIATTEKDVDSNMNDTVNPMSNSELNHKYLDGVPFYSFTNHNTSSTLKDSIVQNTSNLIFNLNHSNVNDSSSSRSSTLSPFVSGISFVSSSTRPTPREVDSYTGRSNHPHQDRTRYQETWITPEPTYPSYQSTNGNFGGYNNRPNYFDYSYTRQNPYINYRQNLTTKYYPAPRRGFENYYGDRTTIPYRGYTNRPYYSGTTKVPNHYGSQPNRYIGSISEITPCYDCNPVSQGGFPSYYRINGGNPIFNQHNPTMSSRFDSNNRNYYNRNGADGFTSKGNLNIPFHVSGWNVQSQIQISDTTSPNGFYKGNNWRKPIALPPIPLPPIVATRPGTVLTSHMIKNPNIRPSAAPHNAVSTIKEERQYRCLGQWDEGELTYTYTQRKDVGTYECFVGKIVSRLEIYIKEAGEHCERGVDPLKLGMKLMRNPNVQELTTNSVSQSPTTTSLSSKRPSSPTKPWKPITAPPKQNSGTRSAQGLLSIVFFACVVCGLQFFLNLRRIQKYWC